MCCKIPPISAVEKSAHQICKYCNTGVGCNIWTDRPIVCKHYFCLWVVEAKFPEELRPDKCGLLIEPGGDHVISINVDLDKPNSWREGIGEAFIEKCLNDGYAVIVQIGTTKHFIIPEGQTPTDVWRRISEDAKRRGFV